MKPTLGQMCLLWRRDHCPGNPVACGSQPSLIGSPTPVTMSMTLQPLCRGNSAAATRVVSRA